jgi:hypothetical protein
MCLAKVVKEMPSQRRTIVIVSSHDLTHVTHICLPKENIRHYGTKTRALLNRKDLDEGEDHTMTKPPLQGKGFVLYPRTVRKISNILFADPIQHLILYATPYSLIRYPNRPSVSLSGPAVK